MGKGTLLIVLGAVFSGMIIMTGVRQSGRKAEKTQTSHQEDILARELARSAHNLAFQNLHDAFSSGGALGSAEGASDGGWMARSNTCGENLSWADLDLSDPGSTPGQVGYVVEGRSGDPAHQGKNANAALHCIASIYNVIDAFPAAIMANNSLTRGAIDPGANILEGSADTFWGNASAENMLSGVTIDSEADGEDANLNPAAIHAALKSQIASGRTYFFGSESAALSNPVTALGQPSGAFASLSSALGSYYDHAEHAPETPLSIETLKQKIGSHVTKNIGGNCADGCLSSLDADWGVNRIRGDLKLTGGDALTGSGLLLVEGNLEVKGNATLDWTGIVLVLPPGGTDHLRAEVHLGKNATINGTLITEHQFVPPGGHIDVTAFRDMAFSPEGSVPQWNPPFGSRRRAYMYAPEGEPGGGKETYRTNFTEDQLSTSLDELRHGEMTSNWQAFKDFFPTLFEESDGVGEGPFWKARQRRKSLIHMKAAGYATPDEAWPFWRHTHKYDIGDNEGEVWKWTPPEPDPDDGEDEDSDDGDDGEEELGLGDGGDGVNASWQPTPDRKIPTGGRSIFRTASWQGPASTHGTALGTSSDQPAEVYKWKCRWWKFGDTPGVPFFDFWAEDGWNPPSGGYQDQTVAQQACQYDYGEHLGFDKIIGKLKNKVNGGDEALKVYLQFDAPKDAAGTLRNHGQAVIGKLTIGDETAGGMNVADDGFGSLSQANKYKSQPITVAELKENGKYLDLEMTVNTRRQLKKLWDEGAGQTELSNGDTAPSWPRYIGNDRDHRAGTFRVQLRMCANEGDTYGDGVCGEEVDGEDVDPILWEASIYWHSNASERTRDIDETREAIEEALGEDVDPEDIGMQLTMKNGASVTHDPMALWQAARRIELLGDEDELFRREAVVSYHWSAGAPDHPYEGAGDQITICHVTPGSIVQSEMNVSLSSWNNGGGHHPGAHGGDYEGSCP